MKMRLKDGKLKVLTLSYDDGVVQDKRLVEILDKHGLKCTFNINGGIYYNGECDPEKGRMTKASMVELYLKSGHEVATHGYTHPFLEKLDSTEVIREITEDRRELESRFGTIVRGHAYPFGTYNEEVAELLGKCGIAYARTTKPTDSFNFPENWLMLHPTCHHKRDLMKRAKEFIENEPRYGNPYMFYVWGHTYEFDDNNNWELIEEFAEYVGGRDDVWYATNIEIYDYVMAYKSLVTSYDKTMIHNPSAIDVWVSTSTSTKKGGVYKIGAGETVFVG